MATADLRHVLLKILWKTQPCHSWLYINVKINNKPNSDRTISKSDEEIIFFQVAWKCKDFIKELYVKNCLQNHQDTSLYNTSPLSAGVFHSICPLLPDVDHPDPSIHVGWGQHWHRVLPASRLAKVAGCWGRTRGNQGPEKIFQANTYR